MSWRGSFLGSAAGSSSSRTFRTFVQNRVEQLERAKREAEAKGVEPEIPPAVPDQLIKYIQCLVCGYKKPKEKVTMQHVCEDCRNLVKYITDQLGPAEDAVHTVYAALQAYFGQAQQGRISGVREGGECHA